VSPVPGCGPGAPHPCLPWRPTPFVSVIATDWHADSPAPEAQVAPKAVDLETARRGECVARARAWGVPEAVCR
jgi:hypothetical protein